MGTKGLAKWWRCVPRLLAGVATAGAMVGLAACAASGPRVAPCDASAERLAEKTLARLTPEEKVALTHGAGTMRVAANPAKGIPEDLVFSDSSSTVRADLIDEDFGHRYPNGDLRDSSTVFPALTSLAATWDPALARRMGEALGEAARARGKDVLLGPGLNIARTPLCGRNWEYMGEDPALAAKMAVPYVRGLQSKDVAACPKHYALNTQEWGRHAVDARPDERTLREIYLPAFEAVVREGGALAIMNGYNRYMGTFCSHNDTLNNVILKDEWGFPGFVTSDWGGVADTVEAANGGTDVEMNRGRGIRFFKRPLLDAIAEGKVPAARLDDMAHRVLYVEARLGKLDGRPRAKGRNNVPEHQTLAREIAGEGMVLLKNDQGLLPLSPKSLKRVLVAGRLADTKNCWGGSSAEGKPPYEITPLQGLRDALPGAQIVYLPLMRDELPCVPIPPDCLLTANPDATSDNGMLDLGWTWERFGNDCLEGKPVAVGFTKAPAVKEATKGFSMRWKTRLRAPESGKIRFALTCDDGARLLLDGKPVIDEWQDGSARARTAEVALVAGHDHALTLEYRQAGGDALLTFGWSLPSERGGAHDELLAEARKADAVLLFTGTNHVRHATGHALECEGGDRPDMTLPKGDDEAIAALLGANPKTAVILNAGSACALPWADRAHTLLLMSYAGQEVGNALADVLFGRRDPGGRLVHSWPRRLEDIGAHALKDYGGDVVHHREGLLVGYRWFDAKGIEPLFPFGHGLSYATFAIGRPRVERQDANGNVALALDVTNTSSRPGSTVVQAYVGAPTPAAAPRPVRQLKAFAKIRLAPGETTTVHLTFVPRDFAYWDAFRHAWAHEAATFPLHIGTSSRDLVHTVTVGLSAWEERAGR